MVNRSFRQLKGQKLQRKQPKKIQNKTSETAPGVWTAANPRCRAQRPCRSPRGSGACEAWRWGAAPPRSGWAGRRRRTRRWTTRSSSTRSKWSRRCRSSAWRTGASPPPRWWCKGLRAEKKNRRQTVVEKAAAVKPMAPWSQFCVHAAWLSVSFECVTWARTPRRFFDAFFLCFRLLQ